jgi:U6 snRNA-associated Sm-like protein LSm6
LTGELQSVDGYMNIALEQAKEYVDGKLHRSYGDAFIRGNNGALGLLFDCTKLTAVVVMYIAATGES